MHHLLLNERRLQMFLPATVCAKVFQDPSHRARVYVARIWNRRL